VGEGISGQNKLGRLALVEEGPKSCFSGYLIT